MKLNRLATLITLGCALTALVATGCKKKNDYLTNIPGRTGPTGANTRVQDPGSGRPLVPNSNLTGTDVTSLPPDDGLPPVSGGQFAGWKEDATVLAPETIHFGFDSATVRKDDLAKLENVAAYLKSHPADAVRVEGHTDKRGTEGYNQALGERRALAAREELVKLGIAADRIPTISFGEDRPVDPAENEAAFAANRRDDFVLLSPPGR